MNGIDIAPDGSVTITEHVKELVYDIQNKAHLTGRSRESEGTRNYESASDMKANDDEDSLYQIKRSLSTAFATLTSLLGEYISATDTVSGNLLYENIDAEGELAISLKVPSNYNRAALESMAKNIHAYLVDMSLGEWFAITDKEDAELYITKAGTDMENVRVSLYRRVRPERPSYV